MRFIIDNNGPYLIHCNEGKDRAGFVSALLECLMGATLDEVVTDYMVTYYNYYGVEEGDEKYDIIVKNNLIRVLGTTFKIDDVYNADLAEEAEEFLIEDAGLTVDEVGELKGKLTITLQEIYDACQTEVMLKNHESVYIREKMDGMLFSEKYLSKEYVYSYIPGFDAESDWVEFITDDADYSYVAGKCVHYLPIEPEGVSDYEDYLKEKYASVILGEEILDNIIESVEIKDGYITVRTVLSSESLEILAMEGIIDANFVYVLDAKTREIISIINDYTYQDGLTFSLITELAYDVEGPEKLKEFLGYENQTENLRKVTVVINPGTTKEVIKSIQSPKGLIIGLRYDGDYSAYQFEVYTDADCTENYDPYKDTDSDLTIYIKWNE